MTAADQTGPAPGAEPGAETGAENAEPGANPSADDDRAALFAAWREAERARTELEDLLAIAAHDLRGPAMALQLWEGLLRPGTLGPAEHARALLALRRGAGEVAALAGELADLSRARRGELVLGRARVAVGPLLRDARARHAPAFAEQDVALVVAGPEGAPLAAGEVDGDPARLAQLLDLLLRRARRRLPSGGAITLDAVADPHHVRVVIDAAPPPAPAGPTGALPAEPASAPRQDVGLTLARALAELHGGGVAIAEPALGGRLELTLPRAPVPRGI